MMARQSNSPRAGEVTETAQQRAPPVPPAADPLADQDMEVITISEEQLKQAQINSKKGKGIGRHFSRNTQDGPGPPGGAYGSVAPGANVAPATQRTDTSHMNRSQMAARIQELEAENAQLRTRAIGAALQQKNFPACWPVVHNDIKNDIPSQRHVVVRTALFAWSTAFIAYLLSWFVVTLQFASSDGKGLRDWIIACAIVIVGVPASWLFWYKNLYHSQSTDRSFPYAKFFLNGGIHAAWCVWAIISPPILFGDSTAGVFNLRDTTGISGGYGIFLTILTIVVISCWGLSLLAIMVVFKWANAYFRTSPAVRADRDREQGKFAGKMFTYAFATREPAEAAPTGPGAFDT